MRIEELVLREHEVTRFASGDSRTSAQLVAPVPRALRLDASPADPIAAHLLQIGMAADRAEEFDVIHSHIDYFAFPFARHLPTPLVHNGAWATRPGATRPHLSLLRRSRPRLR